MRQDTVTARIAAEVDAGRLAADAAQREAAARLDDLRATLRAGATGGFMRLRLRKPAPRGLYLWGGVGRGKTLLMDMFMATLEAPLESGRAVKAERTHFYHFMRDVHAELGSIKQRERPLEIVAQHLAARLRVICLDEFFVSDIGDAMLLAGLFEGLFKRGVTLVTTSNVAPADLYRDGLQRQRFLPAIALLETHLDVIHLDGAVDYRLRQLEQAPTYLDSGDASSADLAQRFAALAGTNAEPADLSIEGRTLHAVATGHGIAWFEFDELCDGPRGQNDYIALARLYQTLIIANVPEFTGSNENAARRFIMLIDELYDRGVKIVVSAAAAPAALYRGERLRFEFERAASRLVEMQTQRYLAGRHRP
jgi:cell division protein ZapE